MANLSEVFIAALRLAAALFGTNKDHANSSSQAPEPSRGAEPSQTAAQEASRPSTSGRSASSPKAPASSKGTASHGVGTSQSAGTSQGTKPTPRSVANAKTAAKSTASRDVHISGNQVWDVARRGLPEFSYQPVADNDADPGEVVWTWISYEEDPTQGKDRPVVVLARNGSDVVVAQLTSKNHDIDREQEAHWGRYWLAIGAGDWDPQGRVSSVRLDRLLLVSQRDVRREGASLDRTTYNKVVTAIAKHWGKRS